MNYNLNFIFFVLKFFIPKKNKIIIFLILFLSSLPSFLITKKFGGHKEKMDS